MANGCTHESLPILYQASCIKNIPAPVRCDFGLANGERPNVSADEAPPILVLSVDLSPSDPTMTDQAHGGTATVTNFILPRRLDQ
jgi:hypothetical protein